MNANEPGKLLFVNYHYIRAPGQYPYAGIHPLAPEAFARQVRDLKAAFHMPAPEAIEAHISGRCDLPGPSVALTFDDGLADHLSAAREALDPLGVKGVFFVCSRPHVEAKALTVHRIHWLRATTAPEDFRAEVSDLLPPDAVARMADTRFRAQAREMYVYDTPHDATLKYLLNFSLPTEDVDRITSRMMAQRGVDEAEFCRDWYMSPQDVAGLAADGHCIGAHGHGHFPFSQLSTEALNADVGRGVAHLTRLTGRPPRWLSYPYGREWALPQEPADLCRRHGLCMGITLLPGWNGPREDPFLLRRVNTNEVDAELRDRRQRAGRPADHGAGP